MAKDKRSGVQLPPWLHELFGRAAKVAGYRYVKDAYSEAFIDWLKKTAEKDHLVKGLLEQEAQRDPDVKLAFSGMKLAAGAQRKPGGK